MRREERERKVEEGEEGREVSSFHLKPAMRKLFSQGHAEYVKSRKS